MSRERSTLEACGFPVKFGRKHRGQGTRNKCILLEKNYIELLYIYSIKEAKTNFLRLDERFCNNNNYFSPFGVVLRGEIHKKDKSKFIPYLPPYSTAITMWIFKDTLNNSQYPLIAVIEFMEDNKKLQIPKFRFKVKKELFKNSWLVKEISSIHLFGPNFEKLNTSFMPKELKFNNSTIHKAEMQLKGNTNRTFTITSDLIINVVKKIAR